MKKPNHLALIMIWLVMTLPFASAQTNTTNASATASTPIEITNINLIYENERTIFTWTTNIPTTSAVDVGRTIALGNTTSDAALVTNHSVTIQTQSGTEYFYRITSCNAQSECKAAPTQNFFAGKLFVTANIPRYSKGKILDISGKTRPTATVSVILNGKEARKAATPKGDFLFRDVELASGITNITLLSVLGAENATLSRVTEIDSSPASMNVSLPPTATSQPLIVNLTLSEPVNLTVTVRPQGEPPLRVGDLQATKIETAKITLTWREISNILEYAVYRDGNRISVTGSPEYIDSSVSPGKTYQYQVSAVAKNCVEGDKSDVATAATPTGTTKPDNFTAVKLTCAQEPQQLLAQQGRSSASVPLREGENLIEFRAIDKAGYVTLVEERIVYDTGPPRFLETNIRQVTPTYQQSITINGKLSETGSVTAILNGKPHKTVLTNPDGTFSIPVKLERSAALQANATRAIGQIVWTNKIKLQAADSVGLTASTPDENIDFQLCGSGTKIQVELSTPTPQILNPRLLMQGVQTIGMSFKYKYNGGQTATIDKNQIKITPVALSPEVAKNYDNGLVRFTAKPLGVRSLQRGVKNEGTGYVQFTFGGIDNPWEQLPELKDQEQPSNATTQAKLEAIANHRAGRTQFTKDPLSLPQTSGCLVPGFGCMKLFFELEIPFQETTGPLSPDPLVRRTQETTKTETQFQRSCLAVEVPIDMPIPPRYIPQGLLKATAEILTSIIEGIDKILKPIETIGKYLFYSCLGGQAVSLVPIFMEKYNCEFASVFSAVSSEGQFNPDVAAIGACDEEYSGTDQTESKENCNDCQYWKERRAETDFLYRRLCDRVMCPSAPSLQFYLKQQAGQTLKPVPLKAEAAQKYSASGFYKPDGKLQVGSDCAAWVKSKQQAESATRTRQPPRLFFTYEQVKGVYTDWLKHQSDDDTGETGGTTVNCDALHPAAPECCGYQYMEEWSSACGLGTFNFLDTFDEIKESTCLSAEKAGLSNFTASTGAAGSTPQNVECGSVLNSIGGFCDPDGSESPHTIRVTGLCCESGGTATGLLAATAAAKEKYLYLLLLPRKAQTSAPMGATTGEYDIRLGTVQETIVFEKSAAASSTRSDQRHRINANLEAIEVNSEPIKRFFTPEMIDKYNQAPNSLASEYPNFARELCKAAGHPDGKDCGVNGQDMYDQVMAIIGTPDQEYIIRPGDGLVNSLRCVCVPTLVAFLKRWRGILGAVRDCMNSILLTGDGSAGICQAVVSQHACDLLYDAIACFTQKFSKPSGSRGVGGIGNVMGALSATGAELSRSAQSRYGESSIYKQVFVDRKLVHSVCLFAFTGTWNFDVGAVFDAAVNEIPTKSYGLMFPCNRRFVSFNPATRPAGLVSWQYQLGAGIAAGSNVENIEVVLKCSGGFKCRESDGFARGKCDCETPKEIVINPEGMPTQARNGEIVNEELFTIIEGAPGDAQIRYDKAYLRWTWNDGKETRQDKTEECTITTDGGAGNVPPECRFDPLSLSFRCSLGDTGDGIQFIETTVRAPQSIPSPVFALEQPIDVELKARQILVEATNPRAGKFIQYSIKNNQGREVAKNDQLIPVTRNGDYTLNVKEDFGASPRVSPSWFGGGTTTSSPRQISQWSSTRNPQTVSLATELLETLSVTDGNQPKQGQYHFIVEISADSTGRETYQLFSANSAQRDVDTVSGLKNKGSALSGSSSGVLARDIIYTGSTAASTATDKSAVVPAINLRLTRAPLGLSPGEKRQLLVSYGLPTVTNTCDSAAGRTAPQAFTLTYTAFDSDQFGQPTDQISIDPATDESVVKTAQFNAVCARPEELSSLVTSSQTATLADKLRRILDILEPMVGMQRGTQATLTELKTRTDATTTPESEIPQLRNRLYRTLAEAADRYQTTQEQMQTAVKNYMDEYDKLSQPEKDKTWNAEAKTAIEEYMKELTPQVTRIIELREEARRMETTPEKTRVSDLTGRASGAITIPDTAALIEKIGGTVGRVEKKFQIFNNNAWIYDQNANKIVYRNPTSGVTKEWTYTPAPLFNSQSSRTTGLFPTETYSTLIYFENNLYDVFYKDGKVERAVSFRQDGSEIGGELTPSNSPPLIGMDNAKQTLTTEFIRLKISPLTGVAPPSPAATGIWDIYPAHPGIWKYIQPPTDIIVALLKTDAGGAPTVYQFQYRNGIYRTSDVTTGTVSKTTTYSALNLNDGMNQVIDFENDIPKRMTVYDNAGNKGETVTDEAVLRVRQTSLPQRTQEFREQVLTPLTQGTTPTAPPPITRLEKLQKYLALAEEYNTLAGNEIRQKYDRFTRMSREEIIRLQTPEERQQRVRDLRATQTALGVLNEKVDLLKTSPPDPELYPIENVQTLARDLAFQLDGIIQEVNTLDDPIRYKTTLTEVVASLDKIQAEAQKAKTAIGGTTAPEVERISRVVQAQRMIDTLTTFKNHIQEKKPVFDTISTQNDATLLTYTTTRKNELTQHYEFILTNMRNTKTTLEQLKNAQLLPGQALLDLVRVDNFIFMINTGINVITEDLDWLNTGNINQLKIALGPQGMPVRLQGHINRANAAITDLQTQATGATPPGAEGTTGSGGTTSSAEQTNKDKLQQIHNKVAGMNTAQESSTISNQVGLCAAGWPCIAWLPQPADISGQCGNGIIDTNEVCDWDRNGNIVLNTAHPRMRFTSGYFSSASSPEAAQSVAKDYIYTFGTTPQGATTGNVALDDYCELVSGQSDCDDLVSYSTALGSCVDNCRSYRPLITCHDEEDDGWGLYYGPLFSLGSSGQGLIGSPSSTNRAWELNLYLWSKWKTGQNSCVPSGKTAIDHTDGVSYPNS